jgi:hypothetical protein
MADTSKLNKVTSYIIERLSDEFGTELENRGVKVGTKGKTKKFSGVSRDSSVIVQVCHHSGRTKGRNIPIGKIESLYSKCYFMEKAQAKNKYIYFTNKEFFEIFKDESSGIIEGIELRYFDDLPVEYQEILFEVIKNASDEMNVS